MSRLDRILNHPPSPPVSDEDRKSSPREVPTTVDSYYYAKPRVPEHKEHPHCPSSLHCLRDTDGRPPHTLPVILRCTILGSPNKKLTIREIYAAMENKYPWYKTAGSAWKQSVRHHLSLNLLFEREPRPVTDPGVGSYWTVNLSAPPGTKRPRKRGRKEPADDNEPLPQPRKRGRPRKYPEQEPMVFDQPPMTVMLVPASEGCSSGFQLPTWSARDRTKGKTSGGEDSTVDEDDDLAGYSDVVDSFSGDDCESEEDQERQSKYLLRPIHDGNPDEPRQDHPPVQQQQQQPQHNHQQFLHPTRSAESNGIIRGNYGGYDDRDSSERTIERLRQEIEGLRQQSADAVSVSVKMSDQLAEAHAEASRARAALRALESRYEEAEKRWKEAEILAERQSRLRHTAEQALRGIRADWRRSTSESVEELDIN